jgi:hypothetical protein
MYYHLNQTGNVLNMDANQSQITTVGTVCSGTWQASNIQDSYIASAATWNNKQDGLTFGIGNTNVPTIGI